MKKRMIAVLSISIILVSCGEMMAGIIEGGSVQNPPKEKPEGTPQETPDKQTYWKATFVKKLTATGDKQQYQSNNMFLTVLKSSASSKMWTTLNDYPSPPYYIYSGQLNSLESVTEPQYSRKISDAAVKTEQVKNGSNITNYYYAEVEAYCYTWKRVE